VKAWYANFLQQYDGALHRRAALLALTGAVATLAHVAGQRLTRGGPLKIHGSVYAAETIAWSLWALLAPAIVMVARRLAGRNGSMVRTVGYHAAAACCFILLHAALHILVRLTLRGDFSAFSRFPELVWFRTFFSFSQEVLFYFGIVALTWLHSPAAPEPAPAPPMPVPESVSPPLSTVPSHLPVRRNGATLLIPVSAVDWIEAERNYVRLYVEGETHLIRETLTSLAARLEPAGFLRVHRSAIVNAARIRQFRPLFHGDGELVLSNGQTVPVGRSYRGNLEGLLG